MIAKEQTNDEELDDKKLGNNFVKVKILKVSNNQRSKSKKSSQYSRDNNNVDCKKLSFFNVEEDEDNSTDSSSSKHDNGEAPRDGDINLASMGNIDTNGFSHKPHYPAKHALKSDLEHDNASSTSSCSCEDHSSVEDQSDQDLHEDLDYDDDSVAGSQQNTPSSNSRLVDDTNADPTSKTTNSTSPNDGNEIVAPKESVADIPKQRSSVENHRDLKSKKPRDKTRIRSFINFNHSTEGHEAGHQVVGKDGSRAHKSHESLLKYFFKGACYFQIKSINHENVELSKSMGVWSTSIQNEIRLNTAFREHRSVILIFSVQQSGAFQGFARMTSESRKTARQIPWILPERLSNKSLGGVFRLEWLCTKELAFHDTHELYNPYNGNKPVKVARDGQQVESKIGKKLCKLFPHDSKKRLLKSITLLKQQTSQRKKSNVKKDNFYPLIMENSSTADDFTAGNGGPRYRRPQNNYPTFNGPRIDQFGNSLVDTDHYQHGQKSDLAASYHHIGPDRRVSNHFYGPDGCLPPVYHRHGLYPSAGYFPPPPNMNGSMRPVLPNIHHDHSLPPDPYHHSNFNFYNPGTPNNSRYHPYRRPHRRHT